MNTRQTFSFELFPPKTPKGFVNMQAAVIALQTKKPAFFSCTYGAGGSTRDKTFATVDWLCQQKIETAPHLTCIGNTTDEVIAILRRYQKQNIRRIVTLRGDRPSGSGMAIGDLPHASHLIKLIRRHFADYFYIEAAAYPEVHPQSNGLAADLDHFKYKVEAGANSAITQYFYNVDAYTHFVEACQQRSIEIPIIPGIMPITNYANLVRFSDACGTEIPRWLRKKLESYVDDTASIQAFGVDFVTSLCEKLLLNGAPGLHFYTMNQAAPTLRIWDQLGL